MACAMVWPTSDVDVSCVQAAKMMRDEGSNDDNDGAGGTAVAVVAAVAASHASVSGADRQDPHVHDTMTVDERPVDGRGSTRPSGDGAHAYLGELQDVEHVHRSLLPAGRVVTLPLVYLRDTVLFPGDELPLKMFPGQSVAAVRSRIAGEGGLLAVVCVDQSLEFFGTTVRVEHFHVGEDDQTAVTGVAKQRFRLKAVRHTDLETLKGDVEILPDYAPLPLPFPVPRTTWKRPNVLPGAPSLPTRRRPLRLPRTPGHWDYRTYRLFDGAALVEQIQQTMLASADWNWFRQMTTDEGSAATLVRSLTLPSSQQDPTTFSFWLAGNIPMDQRQRLELLQINCTVRRLQRLLQLLQAMEEHIYCARCETPLAKTRDIFSMTNQGATGTFLNPGGCVHQTLTLRAIQESNTDNGHEHSTEASWFPGYAWSILHCARCMNHLGWRFDRVDPRLPLDHFFGLRRAALTQTVSRGGAPTGGYGLMLARHRLFGGSIDDDDEDGFDSASVDEEEAMGEDDEDSDEYVDALTGTDDDSHDSTWH